MRRKDTEEAETLLYKREVLCAIFVFVMSIQALTQVTKVYARPITGQVLAFHGGVSKWSTVDRQASVWCDLQSKRYKACFKAGDDLIVTPDNLLYHVEQYFDELEEKYGSVEADQMYTNEENWSTEVMQRAANRIKRDVYQDLLAITPDLSDARQTVEKFGLAQVHRIFPHWITEYGIDAKVDVPELERWMDSGVFRVDGQPMQRRDDIPKLLNALSKLQKSMSSKYPSEDMRSKSKYCKTEWREEALCKYLHPFYRDKVDATKRNMWLSRILNMPSGPVRDEAVKEAKHEDETIGTAALEALLTEEYRKDKRSWATVSFTSSAPTEGSESYFTTPQSATNPEINTSEGAAPVAQSKGGTVLNVWSKEKRAQRVRGNCTDCNGPHKTGSEEWKRDCTKKGSGEWMPMRQLPGLGAGRGATQGKSQKANPCRFWAKGSCKFGDKCRWDHSGPQGKGPKAQSSSRLSKRRAESLAQKLAHNSTILALQTINKMAGAGDDDVEEIDISSDQGVAIKKQLTNDARVLVTKAVGRCFTIVKMIRAEGYDGPNSTTITKGCLITASAEEAHKGATLDSAADMNVSHLSKVFAGIDRSEDAKKSGKVEGLNGCPAVEGRGLMIDTLVSKFHDEVLINPDWGVKIQSDDTAVGDNGILVNVRSDQAKHTKKCPPQP